MASNPNDQLRDHILRFLYERHKTARGVAKIPIGIRDLQREMKQRHKMTQQEVSSNLDYLVQVQWVREVARERSVVTKGGMKLDQTQIKYKISATGINHLEANTMFAKPESARSVNITNIQGVTVVGDGNIVNAELTDLARALDDLDQELARSNRIDDSQRLEAASDVATIRSQIAKPAPNRSIIKLAWGSLKAVATVAGVTNAVERVAGLIGPLLS